MRQTFQQWMVLLSALVLLLLPALLCHAAPMDSVTASSSSGSHDPAFNAESSVPGDRLGIKEFQYYYHLQPKPNMPTLKNEELEKLFHAEIHIGGSPVLFSKTVDESKVHHALEHYGKVWIASPHDDIWDYPYTMVLEKKIDEGKVTIKTDSYKSLHFGRALQDARRFGKNYGDNAMYLKHGLPFAERKDPGLFGYKMLKIKKLRIGDYKLPGWKKIKKESTIYNLRETSLSDLRAHLDQYNYLKGYGSENRLLRFELDKNGNVLSKYLGLYRP
ncbi:uncharacterized protein UHOD_11896 [Ustilago sp. UG-2017b]|nr:uncharacterized protein UHOD_11896 [Ustilago sp. UG-2017b]